MRAQFEAGDDVGYRGGPADGAVRSTLVKMMVSSKFWGGEMRGVEEHDEARTSWW